MYDSHCHLDFAELRSDLHGCLAEARAAGVTGWHVPGCGPSQWEQLSSLRDVPGVTLGVGIHPWWAHEVALPGALESALVRLATAGRELGAVALGECGLDRPRARAGGPSRELQKRVLEAQLVLARELCLPVVLHVVGEHGAMLDLLDRVGGLVAGGVVHGYSGSPELVERYLAHGLHLGFGPVLTSDRARRVRRALGRVPLERLLLETDAPDQAPRGAVVRRGRPSDLPAVVQAAARARGLAPALVSDVTARNARGLFGR